MDDGNADVDDDVGSLSVTAGVQLYVLPPDAVSLTLSPLHIIWLLLTIALMEGDTITCTVSVDGGQLEELTVTT